MCIRDSLVGDYQFISGVADVNFAPHITGIGTGTFSQGREPGQTYARKINIPDDEFGGLITLSGQDIYEKNTDSYNESSIKPGTENEDYGTLQGIPSFGFSLGVGNTTLPTFDGDNSYEIDFANDAVSEDYGAVSYTHLTLPTNREV